MANFIASWRSILAAAGAAERPRRERTAGRHLGDSSGRPAASISTTRRTRSGAVWATTIAIQAPIDQLVYAGLDRLSAVFPSRDAFMSLARTLPHYRPWEPWERLFDYELVDVE